MRRGFQALLSSALLVPSLACSHARTGAAAASLSEVVWPEPPEPPRVRLVAILPDPAAPLPGRPWWRRALDFLAGIDRRAERASLLARPFGVAALQGGSIAVADPDAPGVFKFDPQGSFARLTCPEIAWIAPMAVAAGRDADLYVADGGARAIVRWTAARCTVLARGEMERPTGVSASSDRLFVVDPPRHQVVVLTLSGEVVARWGRRGEGAGELAFPTGIALAPDGSVLVVDALNFRIARFTSDGRWIGSFGKRGDQGDELARPKALATDEQGRVYVSDVQRDLVLVFSSEGVLEYTVGAPGEERGRFALPAGVAVDGGRLYVCDSQNRRVQVFEVLGGRS